MKKIQKLLIIAFLLIACVVRAQEVGTLFFLENAPMRHLINPAFQPVSKGYVNLTPLGYTSMSVGNNTLTMSDLLYVDPTTGKTITPLHPNGDKEALINSFHKSLFVNADMTTNLLGFGFRIKEAGYFHFNVMQRCEMGISTPGDLYKFVLNGGMKGITDDITQQTSIDLTNLGTSNSLYTEISGGYSHRINEKWTVGGKLKVLLGEAYVGVSNQSLKLDASLEEWYLHGNGNAYISGPFNTAALPVELTQENIEDVNPDDLMQEPVSMQEFLSLLQPNGYGGAIDAGFTFKPIQQLQISASLNDFGLIFWKNGRRYTTSIDSSFTGVGEFEYSHYIVDGEFDTDSLMSDVTTNVMQFVNAVHATSNTIGFTKMLNMKMNIGVDANFWDNRVGVGLLSTTRLYDNHLYEELTLGAAFRPVHWFNLALSYSLLQNGKYSTFGAGLSLMPYDGINFTLAMDYIPTCYAAMDINGTKQYVMPYTSQGVNFAFGFSVVWGTNNKKEPKKEDN